MHNVKFSHSGNAGDILYSLPGIATYCTDRNTKAVIYIKLDRPSTFTDKTHPLGSVLMNRAMFDMLEPLLIAQDYIHDVIALEKGEDVVVDFDLDMFRLENKNLSAGDIKLWNTVYYPELRVDHNIEPLRVEPIENDFIIINRTSRYNVPLFDYSILKDRGHEIKFVGVESEFKVMKAILPEIEHLVVIDFYALAAFIAGCKLFVGNQSMAFAIAELLRVRRVLEQYFGCPNVIPYGGSWYAAQTQKQFERIVNNYIFKQ